VEALAEAITRDEEALLEVSPRLHAHCVVSGNALDRLDPSLHRTLGAEEHAVLALCDGRTPAHRFDEPQRTLLRALVSEGVVVWALEPSMRIAEGFSALRRNVEAFRDGAARRRWLPLLDSLQTILRSFECADAHERSRAMDDVLALIEQVGATRKNESRTL